MHVGAEAGETGFVAPFIQDLTMSVTEYVQLPVPNQDLALPLFVELLQARLCNPGPYTQNVSVVVYGDTVGHVVPPQCSPAMMLVTLSVAGLFH